MYEPSAIGEIIKTNLNPVKIQFCILATFAEIPVVKKNQLTMAKAIKDQIIQSKHVPKLFLAPMSDRNS